MLFRIKKQIERLRLEKGGDFAKTKTTHMGIGNKNKSAKQFLLLHAWRCYVTLTLLFGSAFRNYCNLILSGFFCDFFLNYIFSCCLSSSEFQFGFATAVCYRKYFIH